MDDVLLFILSLDVNVAVAKHVREDVALNLYR